jgi:GTP pyrophosphokinase/guanosine-3',5'-bis(diphosphate) 3'-pyrophosphohydrolase
MPLDFAYAVHSDVGDTAVGVKVNGELVPLRTSLTNGDVVEVVRGAKPVAHPDWQNLAVTGRARSAMRRHIRQTEKEEMIRLGRASLDQTLERAGKSRANVSLRPALDRFGVSTDDDLFHAIGRGRVMPGDVLDVMFPGLKDAERQAATARQRIESGKGARLYVKGQKLKAGSVMSFCPICNPVPGDRIVGIAVGDGREVMVHSIDCSELAAHEGHDDVWRDLQWTAEAERNTVSFARLRATIGNAPGVLGQACTIIGEAGGNIVGVHMKRRHSEFFDVDFELDVRDARHLTNIAAALRACPPIETVERPRS